MGITDSSKELSATRIDCNGSFQVKLSLTAAPDIVANPTDIVLILDRSGSMAGSALANLKLSANAFIDIVSDATGGAQSGRIGSGSRIGIVSFAANGSADTRLITSVSELKAAGAVICAIGLSGARLCGHHAGRRRAGGDLCRADQKHLQPRRHEHRRH